MNTPTSRPAIPASGVALPPPGGLDTHPGQRRPPAPDSPGDLVGGGCLVGYGQSPTVLGSLALPEWEEFMHYLYLPVRLPGSDIRLPERLHFLRDAVGQALTDARAQAPHLADPYVYLTARRGFASPENPLNRPGAHCDDFGGTALNYIWTDRYPTRFCVQTFTGIPDDHEASILEFERQWTTDGEVTYPGGTYLRLTPHVVHRTPEVPAPGGIRSFFKVSVATERYNLAGNSHNYLFDYRWRMWSREELRNHPTQGNGDFVLDEFEVTAP